MVAASHYILVVMYFTKHVLAVINQINVFLPHLVAIFVCEWRADDLFGSWKGFNKRNGSWCEPLTKLKNYFLQNFSIFSYSPTIGLEFMTKPESQAVECDLLKFSFRQSIDFAFCNCEIIQIIYINFKLLKMRLTFLPKKVCAVFHTSISLIFYPLSSII